MKPLNPCPAPSPVGRCRAKPRRAGTLLALALAVALPATAQSGSRTEEAILHPFYLGMLEDGTAALTAGNAPAAASYLRTACFGLLEAPARLTECLGRLAIAQARLDQPEEFAETFRRISDLERRFGGYRAAPLSAAERDELEEAIVRYIPHRFLEAVPAFEQLALRRLRLRLGQMSDRDRRTELERLVAEDPGNAHYNLLMAEVIADQIGLAEAETFAGRAMAADPTSIEARCLAALAAADGGDCDKAAAGLAACPPAGLGVDRARLALGCLLETGRFSAASRVLEDLAPGVRRERSVQRLARRLADATAATEAEGGESAEQGGSAQAPEQPPPDAATQPPEALSAEDRSRLAEAVRLASQARYATELAEPLRMAREVAEANPGASDAQHLVAQLAYRASDWQTAAEFFERGGDPGDDQPMLLFYQAVALYETGRPEDALRSLRRCVTRIERTPFVERYVEKILAGG